MKKVTKLFLIVIVLFTYASTILAGPDPSKPFSLKNIKTESKFLKDYNLAKKEYNYKTGKVLDFYVDLQLGAGTTKPNITTKAGAPAINEESKLGYTIGALAYINLFDMLSFTTGISFDGKSFAVQQLQPTGGVKATSDSVVNGYIPANYFTVPLYFNLGGMLTETFGLWFNGGPYLSMLTSNPDNTYKNSGYKNFDFGLNGTLTANYMFKYPFSVIFGTSFKYGGLNNLMSTDKIEKITTNNFTFFSGLRFSL